MCSTFLLLYNGRTKINTGLSSSYGVNSIALAPLQGEPKGICCLWQASCWGSWLQIIHSKETWGGAWVAQPVEHSTFDLGFLFQAPCWAQSLLKNKNTKESKRGIYVLIYICLYTWRYVKTLFYLMFNDDDGFFYIVIALSYFIYRFLYMQYIRYIQQRIICIIKNTYSCILEIHTGRKQGCGVKDIYINIPFK